MKHPAAQAMKKYMITQDIDKAIADSPMPNRNYQNGDLVITVLDRGWVFMGFVTILSDTKVRLDCAYNIHRWGTTEGLGQLCVKGPTSETILNEAGTIYGTPIFVMKVDTSKWF